MKKVIDEETFRRMLDRLAHELLEHNNGAENIALVGIRTRGEFLARRIQSKIKELEGKTAPLGILDITLYRDDLRGKLEQPELKSSEILFDIKNKIVVLVDDVLFTGRTIRSALNALMDIGRPKQVQLLVLVDRGHREVPIKADYVGKNIPTSLHQQVKVKMTEIDKEDSVVIIDEETKI